jgi:hypothetical protein
LVLIHIHPRRDRGGDFVILSRRSDEGEAGVAQDGEGSQATRPSMKPGFGKYAAS